MLGVILVLRYLFTVINTYIDKMHWFGVKVRKLIFYFRCLFGTGKEKWEKKFLFIFLFYTIISSLVGCYS